MKKFTKIVLCIAGGFIGIGIVCIILAFALGFSTHNVEEMVRKGKLNIGSIEKFQSLDEEKDSESANSKKDEITERCSELEIEFGVGELEVKYADVESIEVAQLDVSGYRCYVKEGTLHIQGGLKNNASATEGRLLITIPTSYQFRKVDIEVGAGTATIDQLDAKEFEVQVGAGKLDLVTVGAEEDYYYELECGIGTIHIGEATYRGIGYEKEVTNPGAARHFDVEVGAGEVRIQFAERIEI